MEAAAGGQDEPGLEQQEGDDADDGAQAVPALQVLHDALHVAEAQGWWLDSDHEEDVAEAQGRQQEGDEDQDQLPDAEDLLRRRGRAAQTRTTLPAVPGPAAAKHPAFTGVRRSHCVFQVQQFGTLRYDTNLCILAAHCEGCGHGVCRMNRTCKPSSRRSEQGRPLGYLLAWLLAPHSHSAEFPDRPAHNVLAVRNGAYAHHASVSYAERCRLRAWAKTIPDLQPIVDENLEDGGGSAAEPLELC